MLICFKKNFNLLLFSCIYILIFSGYYLVVGFLNLLYTNIFAQISFVLFYAIYALTSLIAPYFYPKINYKLLLFLSSFTFLFFIGFSASLLIPLLLIGSCLAGIGNAFIWLGQSNHLNIEEMAIFYTLFNFNLIFGNILALIILFFHISLQIMIFIMLGVSAIGVLLILLLPKKEVDINIQTNFLEIFLICKKCYFLIPIFTYQAIGLNITYQIIPKSLLNYTLADFYTKTIYNAIIFIAYGVSAMIFSYIFGKLFIKNHFYVLIIYSILEILCLISIFILILFNTQPGYWIIIGFCRGIIDYGVNNIINLTLINFSNKNYYFGLYRFIYAASYLIFSIIIAYIPIPYILLIGGIFLLFSSIFYILFYVYQYNRIINENNIEINKNDNQIIMIN